MAATDVASEEDAGASLDGTPPDGGGGEVAVAEAPADVAAEIADESDGPDSLAAPDVVVASGWTSAPDMNERREYPGPLLLPDGRVMVTSGHPLPGLPALSSAEIYDPATGLWEWTGSLHRPRTSGGGVVLPDGRVLVGDFMNVPVPSPSELWDPATGEWRITGGMNVERQNYTLTLLEAGASVLATGGIDWSTDVITDACEIYDVPTESWRETAPLDGPRFGHSAVLLPGGDVLVLGSEVAAFPPQHDTLVAGRRFDPIAEAWTPMPAMTATGRISGLVRLHDDRVLVVGLTPGSLKTGTPTAELFDPVSSTWSPATPPPVTRVGSPFVLLADGRVFTAGGTATNEQDFTDARIYDPATDEWTEVAPMGVPRRNHGAVALDDGSVLVMGGSNGFGYTYLRSSERFFH